VNFRISCHPHLFCLICTAWLFSISLVAQSRIDTTLIRQWLDTAARYELNDASISLPLAKKAMAASKDKYYYGYIKGLQIEGESYFTMFEMDSALMSFYTALNLAADKKDKPNIASAYNSLASAYFEVGKRDSSLHYFEEAVHLFKETGDSAAWCESLLRFGNTYNTIGELDRALAIYLESIHICELVKDTATVAYNYGELAVVNDKQKNYASAEEYYLKALNTFKSLHHLYGQMSICNNMGIMYKNIKNYPKAIDAYTQCLLLADSIPSEIGKMYAHTNLGILNVNMGYFENGMQHLNTGLQLTKELDQPEAMADNLNYLARAQLGLHQHNVALKNAREALRIGHDVKALDKELDANQTLSDIFLALHAYDSSLYYFKAYSIVKDSLFDQEKSKQINELQTKYETEKKDKEIRLLAGNAEIDRIKKTRLWIGLLLSVIAGGLLIYAQWIRRVRDKKILSHKMELEAQRRKTTEIEKIAISRELDLKKQELAAKALQLARKNEFLQTLNVEVDKMREHTEGITADAARKISHHIRMDIESENDWEQFLTSFREVHRDYIENLQRTYPDLTKSEIRLACLMKMNLSAKEQAALLNITPDGIKKARYRMRKSMNLESEVDIQEYLMSFPLS
jgi:tetratricopeptide (TPR) repeat protein